MRTSNIAVLRIRWAAWNGLLALGLYFGFIKGIVWIRYATLALIWLLLVSYLALLLSEESRRTYRLRKPPVPSWWELGFDAIALWILFSTGWLLSSFIYFTSSIALIWLYYGRPSKNWIQYLFPMGQKIDSRLVIETSPGISEAIFALLEQQIMLANIESNNISDDEKPFVFGYIAGFCDVYSQAAGARGGESMSMTITAQVLEKIFGKQDRDEVLSLWFHLNDNKNIYFVAGFKAGGEDANISLKKVPSIQLTTYLARG